MCPVSVGTSRSKHALETGAAKLWTLLVGVNHYQDTQLPSLQYSALDCQGLAEALAAATEQFPQKEAIAHHDFAAQPPTLATVRSSLKHLVAAAQPQDTILIYFSGHGILDADSQQVVLCLADTQKDNLRNTGLGLGEFLQLLSSCAAHQQLVWLDACHSGGMTLRGARGHTEAAVLPNPTPQLVAVLRQRAAQSKGFYALLSCDQSQQSWEFPELGHGVFTYYLMRGLRGEAADLQGIIEADGLYKYVYYQTLQYIDKTNQQLRLINQQKRGRGETQLQAEYPLQTPKRIVEGIGELIIGIKPAIAPYQHPRQALVIEGLAMSSATLEFSKLLRGAGDFELDYWPRSGTAWAEVRQAIQTCLRSEAAAELTSTDLTITTALLYLRGHIEETAEGEAWLVLGDQVQISRSWLRQALRRSPMTQQIVILDCPGAENLASWIDDLQLGAERGQCLIAAASPATDPARFTQLLLQTLQAADPQMGLPVAGWIAQLQVAIAGTGIPLHVWLSGTQGVIEVLPGQLGARGLDFLETFDLGLCPYLGLQAFSEADAQYFYGREALTQTLINELNRRPVLAVVGASGSGKSSVVHAGLVAQLQQGKQLPGSEQWWIRSLRPSEHPLTALARRLVDLGSEKEKTYQQLQLEGLLYQGSEGFVSWLRSRPEPMVVLIIDQFEELFTLALTEEREQFLSLIMGAVEHAGDRFKLVFTLRADFISAALEIPALAPILQQSSVLVPPCLSDAEYRQVMTRPAEQVGLQVEAGLVEVLLQELSHAAGDLPLLEFVLEQLWLHREAGRLTLKAYQQQIGGLKGALERKAQAVYDSLDAEAQACAQWIFLTLTQLGDGTADTKRRVPKSELVVAKYPADLVERTLQALTAAKLLVVAWEDDGAIAQSRGDSDSPPNLGARGAKSPALEDDWLETLKSEVTVEVAHEILIRHWSTLRWWLEENRSRLQIRRQLEQAAHLWKKSGEQPDFLLQGIRLAEAEEIYVKYTDELPPEVQRFIEAGLAARQQKQQATKRRQRRMQLAAGAIATLGLVALNIGWLAFSQRLAAQVRGIEALDASSEALLLSGQQLEALTTALKAGRQLQKIQMWSWLLPVSDRTNITAKTSSTLQQAAYLTQEQNRLLGHTEQVNDVAFSPDGQRLASAGDDGTIKLWNRQGQLLQTLSGHQDRVTRVVFSPDGKLLASGSADKSIRLWQVGNTQATPLRAIAAHNDWVTSLRFSPDTSLLASGSRDRTIKLWGVDGNLRQTLTGHNGWVNAVEFSHNGQLLASGSEDKTIRLWRLVNSAVKSPATAPNSPAVAQKPSPNSSSGAILLRILSGHRDRITDLSFSTSDQTLASASGDQTLRLWNLATGTSISLEGHRDQVNSVSFSRDSKVLASASADNTLKLWNADGSLAETITHQGAELLSVRFSPDGSTLVTASSDKTVRLWSRDRFSIYGNAIYSAVFSPDDQSFAIAGWDSTIELWQRDRNNIAKLLKRWKDHSARIATLSFSPDGKWLASGSDDKTIKIWNAKDGSLQHTITEHADRVNGLTFSPDSRVLASANNNQTVQLWNVEDGTLRQTFNGHTDAVTSVDFSPKGDLLASGSYDHTVRLWSIDGQLLQTLDQQGLAIAAVQFSPDGNTLATASWDNTIKLWQIHHKNIDPAPRHALIGHTDGVVSLSFSPDSNILVSGSRDRTLKLWNVNDGTLIKTLFGIPDALTQVSFSANGKTLLSASENGGAMLWNLDLSHLLNQTCDRLHDYLTSNTTLSPQERSLCPSK